jgi:hypothetical protein
MWLGTIRAALEAIIAIPKVIDQFMALSVLARINSIEKRQEDIRQAYSKLAAAQTREERQNAINDLADRWNS